MATGVMTQDDALLRGVDSDAAFVARVRGVAESQAASARPDPSSVTRLVDALLPVVRRLNVYGGDPKPKSLNPKP
jgi:hypothetical protein